MPLFEKGKAFVNCTMEVTVIVIVILSLLPQMIVKEGLTSLTVAELQAASQARGMRAIGMPKDILRFQLEQVINIS